MKNILRTLFILLLLGASFSSCKKEPIIVRNYYEKVIIIEERIAELDFETETLYDDDGEAYAIRFIVYQLIEGERVLKTDMIIPYGPEGPQGPQGPAGKINVFTIEETTMIVDGEERDFIHVRIWLDDDDSGDYSAGDTLQGEFLIPVGSDGDGLMELVVVTRTFDFEDLNKVEAEAMGWEFHNGYTVERDALVAILGSSQSATATSPTFRDYADLLSLRFRYGSQADHTITVKAVRADGSTSTISTIEVQGDPSFDNTDPDTYQWHLYRADLNDLKFTDVERLRFCSEKCAAKCSNKDLFIDDIIVVLKDNGH